MWGQKESKNKGLGISGLRITQKQVALAALVGSFWACAPVQFETQPYEPGGQVVTRCEGDVCFYDVTESRTVGDGRVDILIVNDNSGSMSPEQKKMSAAFANFLTGLGSLDYRIAMITTDVASPAGTSPSSPSYIPTVNGGLLQNGRLIEFAPGVRYLERNTPGLQTLFDRAVVRQETLDCETSGYTNCPAGVEQGIHAANLMIRDHAGGFIRDNASFAVIVLSDEDERGISPYNSAYQSMNPADKLFWDNAFPFRLSTSGQPGLFASMTGEYTLRDPSTFVSNFRAKYGDKSMAWHSIVINPADPNGQACLNQQNGQNNNINMRGAFGAAYARLSSLTFGTVGNICDSNYTNQLTTIGSTIANQVTQITFRCRPVNDQYQLSVNGQPAASGIAQVNFNTDMVLRFTQTLPASSQVELKYTCRQP